MPVSPSLKVKIPDQPSQGMRFFRQLNLKKNDTKFFSGTWTPKDLGLSLFGNYLAVHDQKRKGFPFKVGMKRFESYKSIKLLL